LSNSDKIKSSLLDAFVEDKLLLHQADRLKVEPDPKAVKATMDKIARTQAESRADGANSTRDTELERSVSESLKMQRYVHDYLLKDLSVSDMECEAYYKSHLSGFVTNDIVHVREILVDDPALAQKILAQLKAKRNKNFGDLARVYSKGSSAVEGGDLGHFRRGELPMEFEKAVFALSPGSVSKIVSTKYGYHIFLLDEKIAAHQQKFVEVKDAIREELMLKRERESIQRELESLRRQIPVVIHREKLGFNYIAARSAAGEGRVQ
jgi:parvulin-like peptidyl-prolyl isomerase